MVGNLIPDQGVAGSSPAGRAIYFNGSITFGVTGAKARNYAVYQAVGIRRWVSGGGYQAVVRFSTNSDRTPENHGVNTGHHQKFSIAPLG